MGGGLGSSGIDLGSPENRQMIEPALEFKNPTACPFALKESVREVEVVDAARMTCVGRVAGGRDGGA